MKAALPFLQTASQVLWAVALLLLPVTSFRWFPLLNENTLVRPLALYPLALLLPCLLVLAMYGLRSFPRSPSIILLAIFTVAVLISTILGSFVDPIPLRGQTYFGRAIRAIATLVIGLVFFVSAAWMNRNEIAVHFTLRWLIAGLALTLAWSGLQAITFYTGLLSKEMVTHWQLAFSMRELVRTNRISGLAYEPAWLAGQLATIYVPILFASVMTGIHITSRKWLEPTLLGLSLLTILATYSRGGILVATGAGLLTFMILGRSIMTRAWIWFLGGFRAGWFLRVAMLAGSLLIVLAIFIFLGQKNYFRRLWDLSPDNLSAYLVNINAGARSAYAQGAMAAYSEHPLAGVGLGSSGFWIYSNLPDWSKTTVPEIARQLDPGSRLYPNPKNMYVRLLAETGLLGFCLFFIFLFSCLADSLDILRRGGYWRLLGVAGFFAWVAIALYNLTQDSLATPNIWMLPGILAGMISAPISDTSKNGSLRAGTLDPGR